jgi:hypothetical protein
MIAGDPRWPSRRRSGPTPWPEPSGAAGVVVFRRPRLAGARFFARLALLVVTIAAVGALAGRATDSLLGPALALVAVATAILTYARRWRRTVRRVETSRDGLAVTAQDGRRIALGWDEIAWVESRVVPLVGGLRLRLIRLQRREGVALALPGDLVGLDELIRLVERHAD